jgi:short-subunit dehydrogenase
VDLTGQVALVTGGARGLGLLISRELARQGCKLVICARDAVELARAREDLLPRGAQALLAVSCDVSDRDDVHRLVERAHDAFGPIDVLINAADFERSVAVNFWGTVNATLAVLPEMRERKEGRIVNITSIGGELASVGFSEGVHAELAGKGIVVTTVIPGSMRTVGHAGERHPKISMESKRAARRIVTACRLGEAVLTLTWRAKLLRLVHALAPGFVSEVFGRMNRSLPSGRGEALTT